LSGNPSDVKARLKPATSPAARVAQAAPAAQAAQAAHAAQAAFVAGEASPAHPTVAAQPAVVRPGNSSESLLDKLKEAIKRGAYAPGQRLIEADLMVDLGAGRGPVREALRRLSTLGIIELVPNRGAFVTRFSDKDLFDLFRVREGLEGWAARLSTERVRSDPGVRARFEAAVAGFERPELEDRALRFSEENRLLHQLIIETADNAFLVAAIDRLQIPASRLQIRAAISGSYREESNQEHQAVVGAILQGDPERAETAMRNHLANARDRIFSRLKG
jgi:DNA-binding GntR family transcriptional regulator